MHSTMAQIATKMAMLRQFLSVSRNFEISMTGLDQKDEIEKITIRPEIWWHNLVYHEAEHCMKWPHSANVCIFWSRPVEGAVVLWLSCISLHIYQFMICDCGIDIYPSAKHLNISPYAVGTFSLRRSQNMYALNIAVAVAEL